MSDGTHLYGDRAPHNEEFVVLSASNKLTEERVLTGTSNQIVVTDNGAGSTVILSTPQDIHTGATPTFAGASLDGAVTINESGADADFRVKSSGNANMLVVDAGDNQVGVGLPDPLTTFHVEADVSWAMLLTSSSGTATIQELRNIATGNAAIYTELRFSQMNDAQEATQFGHIRMDALDIADGSEDGEFELRTRVGGALGQRIAIYEGLRVGNPTGGDQGAGTINVDNEIYVDGTQVVGSRVIDARCDDALNSGDATTDGVIDALRDAMITHGLIAAA